MAHEDGCHWRDNGSSAWRGLMPALVNVANVLDPPLNGAGPVLPHTRDRSKVHVCCRGLGPGQLRSTGNALRSMA